MPVSISRFVSSEHLDEVVSAVLQTRVDDPAYPPARFDLSDAESARRWLMEDEALERLVAIVHGRAIGHVAVFQPHDYLRDALDEVGLASRSRQGLAELGQLFVDPRERRAGAGSALLWAAVSAARRMGRMPALAALEQPPGTRRFYQREGLREVGAFLGLDGMNHLFVVDHPTDAERSTTTPPHR